jgi:hypothetical protein
MNKYRPGGRCGGDSASKETKANPEFNSSLASLLQQREQQDALFHGVSAHTPVAVPSTKEKKELAIVQKPVAKDDYIKIIMEGDYE